LIHLGIQPSLMTRYFVECKIYSAGMSAAQSNAVRDLLAYRRDWDRILRNQSGIYGLGVVWGQGLKPVDSGEIALCSHDELAAGLQVLDL
jgi:hypothetical protein